MSDFLHQRDLNEADPRIVCAADDAYALPAAVAIRSAAERLAPDRRLGVFLFDSGISESNRGRVESSLPKNRVALEWIPIKSSVIDDFPTHYYFSSAIYSRLLIPLLLPKNLDKVIYLDADCVIEDDLCQLWSLPLENNLVMAVQDLCLPYFDNERAQVDLKIPHLHWLVNRPIENYEALELDPLSPYFNTGLLLINVKAWRKESITKTCFDVLRLNRAHAWLPDQYALNIAVVGRWRRLATRWNTQESVLMRLVASGQHSWPSDEIEAAIKQPAIVHYTGHSKPWNDFSVFRRGRTTRADFFHRVRKRTAWTGVAWYWRLWIYSLRSVWEGLKMRMRRD